MAWIARISGGVSRDGDVRGQEEWSSSEHALCRRLQAWNRLGDTRRNRKRARNGTKARARTTTVGAAPSYLLRKCPSITPCVRVRQLSRS